MKAPAGRLTGNAMRALFQVAAAAVSLACTGANAPTVDVAYAGSLVTPMERSIGPAFAAACRCEYRGEGKGSVAFGHLIAGGIKTPDVFISADTRVLQTLITAPTHPADWYATLATARLVVGYSPKSRFARRFADSARGKLSMAQLLETPGLRIGATDPKLDPKGYRSLIALQLIARHFKDPRLAALQMQTFAEESLLVHLEDGDVDAAFLYSTESASRHVPALELPADSNLGHPAWSATYHRASARVDDVTYYGAPIVYAFTILREARNPSGAIQFVHFILTGEGRRLLERAGLRFIVPQVTGHPPGGLF